ncbi:MAG: replication-associated recombination protein A [Gammaproteobacteria bacterium]|nr:replication-associated recombination protein A [Gammaproteobacteria bacterium]NNC68764.1 replication-associated recombination protein A [Gammaproteobacteria bacterium]
MRPRTLDEFVGQTHLLSKDKPLRVAIEHGKLHSMIFWGPPGTGKTTLARIISNTSDAQFIPISAVLSGVKEIRQSIDQAKAYRQGQDSRTVLFVDEVHRFNKAQQDAFLPHIEDGTIYFIGATTENPSFELNNALLSRARTYVLKRLTHEDIQQCIEQAIQDKEQGLNGQVDAIEREAKEMLAVSADGDARRALNFLEIAVDLLDENTNKKTITKDIIQEVTSQSLRRFDKQGEYFYDQISALHKSVRGSDPDAALYWFCRIIDGGCDPHYIARRVVRMASEDIGNADPRGLQITVDAWNTYDRLGSPEGELAIAHAIVYLSCVPKSNAVYTAYKAAMSDAKEYGTLEVPMHLRNAPTKLMKEIGYGEGYRYAHDEEDAYAAGEVYLPEELKGQQYYFPEDRGLEVKIKQHLETLRQKNKQ